MPSLHIISAHDVALLLGGSFSSHLVSSPLLSYYLTFLPVVSGFLYSYVSLLVASWRLLACCSFSSTCLVLSRFVTFGLYAGSLRFESNTSSDIISCFFRFCVFSAFYWFSVVACLVVGGAVCLEGLVRLGFCFDVHVGYDFS